MMSDDSTVLLSGMGTDPVKPYVKGAVPSWDTVATWPPWIMMFPLRAGPGLDASVMPSGPFPTPVPPPVMLIQGTVLHATQLQVPDDAVTVAVAAPPAIATLPAGGAIVNVQPGCGGTAMTMPLPSHGRCRPLRCRAPS